MSLGLPDAPSLAAGGDPAKPAPATASPPAPPAPPAAARAHFDLNELQVVGNTVLPAVDVEAAVYPFLGPDKTAEDVEKARAALEELYSKRGYPTVSAEVPPQHASSGVVVIKVVERPVGRLRVTGARYFSLDAIKNATPSLAEGTVPNLKRVENDIIGLNQIPDRTVTPALKPGRVPDTVDADLQVADTLPVHGSLELNNRYSADTTPLRLQGSLSYGNLWQRGDSASFLFQVAPERPSDATVFSGSYLFRIPDSRLSLLGSILDSNSNVNTVGSTNVVGKGQIVGLRLLDPLGLGEGFIHSLSAGFDYKDLIQQTGLGTTSSNVPIQYVPFSVGYQAGWTGANSKTDLLTTLVWAVQGIGSSAAQFDQNRYDAPPNFVYLRGDFSRVQTLPYNIEAYARVQAQLSPDPLVSSEQFSLGGEESVRGYLESEALGDYGATLQTELRTPPLAEYVGGAPVQSLRGYGFLDVGGAQIHNPLPGQIQSYSFSSAGVGVRLKVTDYLNGSLEDAQVMASGPNTKAGTNRILFRVFGEF